MHHDTIMEMERYLVDVVRKAGAYLLVVNYLRERDGLPPRGLFASLTDEQRQAILAYEGLIFSGDPSLPRVNQVRIDAKERGLRVLANRPSSFSGHFADFVGPEIVGVKPAPKPIPDLKWNEAYMLLSARTDWSRSIPFDIRVDNKHAMAVADSLVAKKLFKRLPNKDGNAVFGITGAGGRISKRHLVALGCYKP